MTYTVSSGTLNSTIPYHTTLGYCSAFTPLHLYSTRCTTCVWPS